MRKFLLCLLAGWVCSTGCFAQQISNVQARIEEEEIIITYDLSEGLSGQVFEVQVYASSNNFSEPLQLIAGDAGTDQRAGSNKQVTWSAREELGSYSGDLEFEIRATIIYNPVRVLSPQTNKVYKGGKTLSISWQGGSNADQMQIELLRGTEVFSLLEGNSANDGLYEWPIPKKIEKNTTYKIRITGSNRHAQPVESGFFTLRKKGSPVVPLIILGAGGAAAAVLTGGGSGGGDPNDDLPVAPGPPDGG